MDRGNTWNYIISMVELLVTPIEILYSIACWSGGFVFFILLVLIMVICQQLRMRSRGEGIWGNKLRQRQDAIRRKPPPDGSQPGGGPASAVPEINIISPHHVPNQSPNNVH